MKILNLYFSSTGNTARVADRITTTVKHLGHQIDTVKITGDADIDLLSYDFIFIGSGVYQWLPGKAMQEFIWARLNHYASAGEIKPASPRRPGKKCVVTVPTVGPTPASTKLSRQENTWANYSITWVSKSLPNGTL